MLRMHSMRTRALSPPQTRPQPSGRILRPSRWGRRSTSRGKIAIDPKTKQLTSDASIEDQTKHVLENLKAVLAADGMTLDNVVSTTVYVKDLNDFGKVNEVYATFFTSAPPARATVEVARLPKDAKIEISAIALHP